MGSSDVPPATAPSWLIPVQTALLGAGVVCWDITYILMFLRSRTTKSSGVPLLGLALNVSWEIAYAFVVADTLLERVGFATWLALDGLIVYSLLKHAGDDWRESTGGGRWVARHLGWVLYGMVLVGCVGQAAFVLTFFARPGLVARAVVAGKYGVSAGVNKAGKFWRGREGLDTTELSFWSAGLAQDVFSAASLAQLVARGHSGGTGYLIWFVRFVGSLFGMQLAPGLLWWYWPEAHGFWLSPLAIFMSGFSILCDLAYLFVLRSVRKTEVKLPDGRLVAGDSPESVKVKPA
ncbi:uncharacterized protein B0I36DRAFT_251341 [Microdochium trichocladiopsis]|uniref:Uncharacterized protein n=1 Tax=Microdochium trichocladiopsis TaxID=1682393 RepID=A0A9P8Y0K7_9PEZI|nr:uncharacterized protein B0I36DRAFT_251341 [Microdochium trichocladiopsis]KAH7025033.1 hypothetical protein B0I36DRAFT_251341 [Microdochium trichocladiopsis]